MICIDALEAARAKIVAGLKSGNCCIVVSSGSSDKREKDDQEFKYLGDK